MLGKMRTAGVGTGVPFVLQNDASYDHELSRVLRAMAAMVGSMTTRTYAGKIYTWVQHLEGVSRTWRTASYEDVLDFKRKRYPPGGSGVSASTWNGDKAALTAFYKAANPDYS
jgi:hypothetical protein